MAKSKKKRLTKEDTTDIVLSDNEKRMINSLRRIAKMYGYGSLTAEIDFHDGALSKGRVVKNELKL